MLHALERFAVSLLLMLEDYLTSKKVLTAVLTAVAGALIKDPAVRDRVVAAGLLLLGGIAAADHGSTAAKLNASSADLLRAALEGIKDHLVAAPAPAPAAPPPAPANEVITVPKLAVVVPAPATAPAPSPVLAPIVPQGPSPPAGGGAA